MIAMRSSGLRTPGGRCLSEPSHSMLSRQRRISSCFFGWADMIWPAAWGWWWPGGSRGPGCWRLESQLLAGPSSTGWSPLPGSLDASPDSTTRTQSASCYQRWWRSPGGPGRGWQGHGQTHTAGSQMTWAEKMVNCEWQVRGLIFSGIQSMV